MVVCLSVCLDLSSLLHTTKKRKASSQTFSPLALDVLSHLYFKRSAESMMKAPGMALLFLSIQDYRANNINLHDVVVQHQKVVCLLGTNLVWVSPYKTPLLSLYEGHRFGDRL